MSYVYIRSERFLWTVGFYRPDGQWEPDSDHADQTKAAERVAWLNGSWDRAAVEKLAAQLEQDATDDDATRNERIAELVDATGSWSSRDPDVARLRALVETQRSIAADLRRALTGGEDQ